MSKRNTVLLNVVIEQYGAVCVGYTGCFYSRNRQNSLPNHCTTQWKWVSSSDTPSVVSMCHNPTWEGIWALVELGPLLCMPIPFSVRNSSRSMYCSWKRPPSHGRVLSHSSGPRKADWELGRSGPDPGVPPVPPGPPLLMPSESSSESCGLSLSGGREGRIFQKTAQWNWLCLTSKGQTNYPFSELHCWNLFGQIKSQNQLYSDKVR